METNTLKKISRLTILFVLGAMALACSGEDGMDGDIGPQGTAGVNGIDGNANVRTFVFNEVEFSSESIVLDMTGVLTSEVVKRDVILVYLRVGNESLASRGRVFNLPSRVLGSFTDGIPTQFIDFWLDDFENGSPERIIVRTRSIEDTTLFPDERTPVDWIKVVIIESTITENLSGKSMSSTNKVIDDLKSAGVDINNYYSVCEYFGVCED
jgi:hypothetical protein